MAKNLIQITYQKKELESDLYQDIFLKEYEWVFGYKLYFEFKSMMQVSMRLQRTLFDPLFKFADEVTKVRMEVEDILDTCVTVSFR